MLKNFLIIAYRILVRHKAYSLINISGLAIGIASAILILLYVQDELTYDKFHENHNQIYRAGLHATNQGNEFMLAISCVPLAPTLIRDYPEVISATRIFTFVEQSIIKYKDNRFLDSGYDSGFEELVKTPKFFMNQPQFLIAVGKIEAP